MFRIRYQFHAYPEHAPAQNLNADPDPDRSINLISNKVRIYRIVSSFSVQGETTCLYLLTKNHGKYVNFF